jgi:hypothetical protein
MRQTAPTLHAAAVDRPRETMSAPPGDTRIRANPPAAPVDVDAVAAGAGRVRLCVLCGRPVRAGQHILRVHGSTIHARCAVNG